MEGIAELAARLELYPPFDALTKQSRTRIAEAAAVVSYRPDELVLDAFAEPATALYLVLSGQVQIWNSADRLGLEPDEILVAGGLFGYSAMLTGRRLGPRVVATDEVRVAVIPTAAAMLALASGRGARFLAESFTRRPGPSPQLALVDDLVGRQPLFVEADTPAGEVARLLTEQGRVCAVVRLRTGFGLVTDGSLRRRVVAEGVPSWAPAHKVLADGIPSAQVGESASQVLIRMLDADAEAVLVLAGEQIHGVVTLRDFALGSTTTADRSLRERIRTATGIEDLQQAARGVPELIDELYSRGLAAGMTIALFSSFIDTVIRRAIHLVLATRPDLSQDDFTWLALGSNGRREAVLSSDVDSAVAFVDGISPERITQYRGAFTEIERILGDAGLRADGHGASASRKPFARTNAEWRQAARGWLADPVENKGAIMTSLLVDGRPIYGDPGLTAVSQVFADLRSHPGTMRLLLQDSLARKAKLRSTRDALLRRHAPFNVKDDALLPVVNLARWAALSVGSPVLPTVERLRTASGSAILPEEQAAVLIEVFEVLQRLRLRSQLAQLRGGLPASDDLTVGHLSPIDRSVVSQAVREISGIQRRMASVAHYVPTEEWTLPEPT